MGPVHRTGPGLLMHPAVEVDLCQWQSCVQMPDVAQATVTPFEYVDVPVSAQGGAAQQEQYGAQYAAGQYDASAYGQGQYASTSTPAQSHSYGGGGAAATPSQYGGYAPQPAAPAAQPAYNQFKYDPAGNYGQERQTYLQTYPSAEPKSAYQAPPQQPSQQQQQQPPLQQQHSGYSTAGAAPPVRQFAPKPPAGAGAYGAPPAPTSPYSQAGGAPSHPHSPPGGLRAQQQFAPEPPQPQMRAPAVFQPMHAAAPRPAPQPQQMQGPPQHQAPPAPPAPPAGPPPDCTVYNVDTSKVTGQSQVVVQNLMGLFQVWRLPSTPFSTRCLPHILHSRPSMRDLCRTDLAATASAVLQTGPEQRIVRLCCCTHAGSCCTHPRTRRCGASTDSHVGMCEAGATADRAHRAHTRVP